MQHLGELAKRAVGFDPARGDMFEITSAAFSRSSEPAAPVVAPVPAWREPRSLALGGAAALVLVAVMLGLALRGRRAAPAVDPPLTALPAGKKVAEIEAALAGEMALPPKPEQAGSSRARPCASARDRLPPPTPPRPRTSWRAWMTEPNREGKHG